MVYNEICRASGVSKQKQGLRVDNVKAVVADPDWNEHFYDHILRVALEKIRPRFGSDTWEAFTLVWLHSKSAKDVPQSLNRSLDLVYPSKSRIIKRLRLEV